MTNMIGLSLDLAKQRLEDLGFSVHVTEYVSKRGVEDADSTRVIRQKKIDEDTFELTVSHFKTHINEQEQF